MDIELLKRKAAQADRALARINGKLSSSVKKFEQDYDAQDIVYRNFQILIQNCVDMGAHIIAVQGWPSPKTMGEIFEILATHKQISSNLGRTFRKAVTLRNILVHDYARLNHKKAYQMLKQISKLAPIYCLKLIRNRV